MFSHLLASATARCNTNLEEADLYCWGQIKKNKQTKKHTLISAVKTDRIESGSHCGEHNLEPGGGIFTTAILPQAAGHGFLSCCQKPLNTRQLVF